MEEPPIFLIEEVKTKQKDNGVYKELARDVEVALQQTI